MRDGAAVAEPVAARGVDGVERRRHAGGGGLGEPTIADAILDRIIHNAHRIELTGESMRKKDRSTRLTQPENPEIITTEQ